MNLNGKAAIVTGGSGGIGREIVRMLAQRGANVAVNYVSHQEAAEQIVAEVKALGRQAISWKADVRDAEQVKQMVEAAVAAFGTLDILVNNAGIIRDNFVSFMKESEWDEVLDVNLKGAFHCIKYASKAMMRKKSGRIINISSDAGLLGDVRRANYCASKAGLIGMTKAVARELAASGITVNAICPGIIETEMIAHTIQKDEKYRTQMLSRIPMARLGQAKEVATLVAFLASEDAAYITGQALCVDGGLYM